MLCEAQTYDTNANANPSEADTESAEGPSGGNDIGLWPAIIQNGMREYWIIKGIANIQHCDEGILSQHSVQQPRNDREVQRKCTAGKHGSQSKRYVPSSDGIPSSARP